MRFYRVTAAVAIFVVVLAAGLWWGLPLLAKSYLEERLGKIEFEDVVKAADRQNRDALAGLGEAVILIDVPADSVIAAIKDSLINAAATADLKEGWKLALDGEPVVSFHPSDLRVAAPVTLSSDKIGSASLTLTLDVVPFVSDDALHAKPVVTGVKIRSLRARGLKFPDAVAGLFENVVTASLAALNAKIPTQHIPLKLPENLLEQAKARPAVYVSNAGIAVLLGSLAASPGAQVANYGDAFVETAKTILPSYAPGKGVVAVKPKGKSLHDVSDALRDDSAASNLAAFEAMLAMDGSVPPETIAPTTFAGLAIANAEGRWFERRLKGIVLDAIAKIKVEDVVLTVKPDDVIVKLQDGVAEATASGKAVLGGGKLSVDFSLTAWAVMRAAPGGVIVNYAPREIRISNLSVAWGDRGTTLTIPYEDGLGQVVARLIANLPESLLKIPAIDIKVASDDGAFKLATTIPSTTINFTGRAAVISPEGVEIFAVPSLEQEPAQLPQPELKPGQLARLIALSEKARLSVVGETNDSLSLAVAKPGFAHLLEAAWIKLDPSISAHFKDDTTFDAGEIPIVPADASCGNPCKGVESCGDILSCKINICEETVTGTLCSFCPGFVPGCSEVCKPIKELICKSHDDSNCIDRIKSCGEEVTKCTTAWSSGLQLACEAALQTIEATDLRGLAKVSGGTAFDASAATMPSARLVVKPDLTGLDLTIEASAQAGLDAWLNIVWTDFGNLLACPSGKLAVHLDASASLTTPKLTSSITWAPSPDTLKATLSFGKAEVLLKSDPPLEKLITSNPGLLTCAAGQAIVGLTIVALPKLTQGLLADAIRAALPGDKNAKMAALLIDGEYRASGNIPSTSVDIPATEVMVLNQSLKLVPRMADNAVIIGTGPIEE
ncbi:hypothetical protein NKJ86_29520 [Mesorhizobium sp. M0025]|uniref:hypothetical protein n=1 Tax=Mesorhizobium sp. M0025 TaxID=2956846 RepID=UPI003338C30A